MASLRQMAKRDFQDYPPRTLNMISIRSDQDRTSPQVAARFPSDCLKCHSHTFSWSSVAVTEQNGQKGGPRAEDITLRKVWKTGLESSFRYGWSGEDRSGPIDPRQSERDAAFRLSVEALSLPHPCRRLPLPRYIQPGWGHRPARLQVLSEVTHAKVSLFLRIFKWARRSDNPSSGAQFSQGGINTIKVSILNQNMMLLTSLQTLQPSPKM